MTDRRTDMHKLQELVRLHRQGRSARDAAQLLRISRNTVRGYLTAFQKAELLEGSVDELPSMEALKGAAPKRKPRQETSTIAVWIPRIQRMTTAGAGPRAIYDLLSYPARFHQLNPAKPYRFLRRAIGRRGREPRSRRPGHW